MFQIAYGKMGISYDSFWEMTPREFSEACKGYAEKVKQDAEITRNLLFASARYHAAHTASPNEHSGKAGRRILKAKFAWEKGAVIGNKKEPIFMNQVSGFLEALTKRKN